MPHGTTERKVHGIRERLDAAERALEALRLTQHDIESRLRIAEAHLAQQARWLSDVSTELARWTERPWWRRIFELRPRRR